MSKPVRTDRRKNGLKKQISIDYYIRLKNGMLIKVCQKAFCGVLNVGKDRVQRVCKRQLVTGTAPIERRGGNRKAEKFASRRNAIIAFIRKFKVMEVHYCRSKISKRQYLPSELSINKMYAMYDKEIMEVHLKVKCSYFRSVFNEKFNIGFREPSTDLCSMCQMYKEKIKYESNSEIKQKLMIESTIHKRRAKAFFEMLREEKPSMVTFSFDCQKNMALPKLPDQAAYFSRQISLYNFGMVQGSSKSPLTRDNVFLYVWGEFDRPKGSNEIASAVYHRLCRTDVATDIDCIRLIADGCGGQNKNSIMVTMCMYWLATKAPTHIKKLELIFPVAGHSFIPPDRVFAKIEKDVKNQETIVNPSEYMKIYEQHGKVVSLGSEECPVFDWKSVSTEFVKPPGQWHFKFNESKRFILTKSTNQNISVRGEVYYKSDLGVGKTVTKKGKLLRSMAAKALSIGINIKEEKLVDVNKLIIKHFGKDWHNIDRLLFFAQVMANNSDQNAHIDVEDLICEHSEEHTGFRI